MTRTSATTDTVSDVQPSDLRARITDDLQTADVTDKLDSDHTIDTTVATSLLSPDDLRNVKTLEAQAVECDQLADHSQTRREMESWMRTALQLRRMAQRIRNGQKMISENAT